MGEATVIELIRHAEPDYGGGGRICLGRKLDVPLSETGKMQAQQLRRQFKDIHLDAIYTSPLIRARQTAEVLPQTCRRIVAEELTEVDSGEWDGMRFSEIYASYPGFFDNSKDGGGQTPPGGESDEEALARGMSLLNRLAGQEGKHFALITHSGLGRILVCHLLGFPLYQKRTVPMQYASCTHLRFKDGSWEVSLSEELLSDRI